MSLLGMFSGFPSFKPSATEMKMTVVAYLSTLEGFPLETVQDAARQALKAGGAFPPSSPEFYEICSRVASERHAEQKRLHETGGPVLPRPVETLTEDEREASKARVQAIVDEFKNGHSMAKASKSPEKFKFSLGEASTNGWSDEQLADPNCIVNRPGKLPYTMRPAINGMLREYGFLTRAEANSGRKNSPVDEFKNVGAAAKASKTSAETEEAAQSWLVENAGGHGQSPVRISAELAALFEDQRR
jgi:hypothetical protein